MGCGSGRCEKQNNTVTDGCNNGCASGGCNKLNSFDWLSDITKSSSINQFNVVEVSFKNGSRKGFYLNSKNVNCITGDRVIVEAKYGYDLGRITLSGELVRLQMKKKGIRGEITDLEKIIRVANEDDIKRAEAAWALEHSTMLMSRVIAQDLKLDMKIGDVEYQADGRKATFYYIADERVDFRELIKVFAKDFQVKIEMRQIGARHEAGRIGGIGSCGRELCCSSWLTKYKSVNTTVARYQNLAINQSKLSGQCGRLKCCLNYELDTYLDALQEFPKDKDAEFVYTEQGRHRLIKTDIFKRKMWYALPESSMVEVGLDRIKEVIELNKQRINPPTLIIESDEEKPIELGTIKIEHAEEISLPDMPKEKRNRNRNRKNRRRNNRNDKSASQNSDSAKSTNNNAGTEKPKDNKQPKNTDNRGEKHFNRNKNRNRNNPNKPNNNKSE